MSWKKSGYLIGACIFPVVLGMVVFHGFLDGSSVLMTTDAVISTANVPARQVLTDTFASWHSGVLMGLPRSAATQMSAFLKAIQSGIAWNNTVYGLALLASSLVWIIGWRRRFATWALLAGALTAFWVGSNFTLLYAGHIQKPFVVLFFLCSLLCAGIRSWRGGILWGGCIGLMFVQQPDVAMFFALFSGTYLVFRLCREEGIAPANWLKVLAPAVVVTLLFAAGPLLTGYNQQVKGTAQMQTENKEAKWDYITQWSLPPDEVVDFVAPGYFGWRSGEPEGPYRGRMGRSPGWEKTKQGFQNFKLESTYIGLIPVGFSIFALFVCRRSKHRAEILFWAGATVVSLLLAFGKYFPLYALFYKLPVVNNIRNPNKFIQVFQVCVSILAVYGFDALWRSREEGPSEDGQDKPIRAFFWTSVGALVVFGLWALVATLSKTGGMDGFVSQGWPREVAETLVQNKAAALWHMVFMAAILAGVFAIFSMGKAANVLRFRNGIFAVLVLIVAADAVKLSKHYVQEMPRCYIEANALTDFLEKDLGHQRVALLSQQGIYNIWISYLLPYHRIATFNISQIGRMPQDYQQLLSSGSKQPLRMWRFAGVKYLLAPAGLEAQLPAGEIRKVFAYDLAAAPENEFRVVPNPSGAHAVFEFADPIPRYALVPLSEAEEGELVLSRIADPQQPLPGARQAGGSVRVVEYRPGRVELAVEAEEPCMLRAAERWDADWKARVDADPVEVQQIDFICQGVKVPAGRHQVILAYAPPRMFFYMQSAGFILLLGAVLGGLRSTKRQETIS